METENTNLLDKNSEDNSKNEKENNAEEQAKKIEKEVEVYTDIEGLSTKKLNFGLWYVQNRKKIRGGVAVFLIIISLSFGLYAGYHFAYYYAIGIKEDQKMVQEMIDLKTVDHDYLLSLGPEKLLISSVESRGGDTGLYDFFVKVENRNPKHYAIFKYCFEGRAGSIECGTNFILPSSSKYILALSQETSANNQIIFKINELNWRRVSLHKYPNWEQFKNDRIDFKIEDYNFTPSTATGLSEKISLNQLEFTIKNNTIYNYWSVPLNIILYSGSFVAGVNQYTVTRFMSEESRTIILSWPGSIGSVSNIEVSPELNILKDDIYIRYEGDVEIQK